MKKSSMSPRSGWLGCTTRRDQTSAPDVLAITIGNYPGKSEDWIVIFVTDLPRYDYEPELKRSINRRYKLGEFAAIKNAKAAQRHFTFTQLVTW